jgi:DNA-binding MarR family transcriptional regulator
MSNVKTVGTDTEDEAAQATQLFFSVLVKLRLSAILERLAVKLTPSQMTLLYALYETPKDGLPMGRLAEELGVSAPAVTALTDRLQRDGYLVKATDAQDRRVVCLTLTEPGRAAVDDMTATFEDLFRPLLAEMSQKDRLGLIHGMEHIYQVARKMREHTPGR